MRSKHLSITGLSIVLLSILPLLAQDIQWARQFGTARADEGLGVAVLDGNVYVVGEVTLPFDPSVNTSPKDAFIRRYDGLGNEKWAAQFGATSAHDAATSVAVNAGGVYVGGWTNGELAGTKTSTSNNSDAFLRKYDLDGKHLWTRQFASTSGTQVYGVALDTTGVYVAGLVRCCASSVVPPPKGPPPAEGPPKLFFGADDAFVSRFDFNGNLQWAQQFGTGNSDQAWAVAADATGVYVGGSTTGSFATTVPETAGPVTCDIRAGDSDVFVAKFASDARFSWVSQCGTSKGDELRAIALGADSIYIGGQTLGAWPGETHLNGLWDAWVMQLDSKGNRTWVDQFGEGEVDNVLGLAVGFGANHLLVGGAMDRHLVGRVQDAFFRLYDSRGNLQTNFEFGNNYNDYGTAVAADARSYYMAGTKTGVALGLPYLGESDAFVMKVAQPALERLPGPRPEPPPAIRGGRGR